MTFIVSAAMTLEGTLLIIIVDILRTFDMTSKYGPSVGITRLQRWERAKKWGLSPPDEVSTASIEIPIVVCMFRRRTPAD
jgi:hypothetical protein